MIEILCEKGDHRLNWLVDTEREDGLVEIALTGAVRFTEKPTQCVREIRKGSRKFWMTQAQAQEFMFSQGQRLRSSGWLCEQRVFYPNDATGKPVESGILSAKERCDHFNESRFVRRSGSRLQIVNSGRIEGIWNLGGNFRRSNPLHGSYLGDYYERVTTLFPEAKPETTVHLFSGGVPIGKHYRVDMIDRLGPANNRPDPRFLCSKVEDLVPGNSLPWVRDGAHAFLWPADPPYWQKDCDIYGCPPVNRPKCFRTLAAIVPSGSFVVWLDPVEPMTRKREWEWYAAITLRVCAGHQGRFVSVYRRQ